MCRVVDGGAVNATGGLPDAGPAGRARVAVRLWAWALCGTAALPLAAAFDGAAVVVVLLGALALPFGVVALGARLRVPAWAVTWATVTCVLLAGLTVLRAEVPPPATVPAWRDSPAGDLLGPLLDSVARLLTGPAPAPLEAAAVTPVAVLCAVVGLGVALATTRARPGSAPLVGGVVLYVSGLLLTAGAGDPAGLVAAAVVTVAALGWLLLDGGAVAVRRARPRLGRATTRARTTWSSATSASALVVLVLAAVAVVGPAVTSRPAFEPRAHVDPPVEDLDLGHPLPQLAVWASRPDEELFRVTGDVPERMSLVVLPDFDGASWRADVALRAVGTVATPDLAPGATLGRVEARVTLSGLAEPELGVGGWLPAAGRVVGTDAPGALTDPATGSLLAAPLAPGDAYVLEAEVDQPSAADLRRAGVPSRAEAGRYLDLPRLPRDLADYARGVAGASSSRLEQVAVLQEVVRGDRELRPEAFSGSSYARVREVLFAERADGGQAGSSEQYAAAFAVLARAVGVPTRLVLGFVLPPADADGVVAVRGGDAHVWPEVYLAGPGWVPVDPTPARTDSRSGPQQLIAEAGDLTEPVRADELAEEPAQPSTSGGRPVGPEPATASVAPGQVVVTVLGAAAGLAVLVAVVLAVARARRTAALRRAGPVGAWQHVQDAAVLAGTPPAPHESATALAARLDGDRRGHLMAVAARAEHAAFAPDGPPSAAGQDWAHAAATHRRLRHAAPVWRRLTWPLRPVAPLRAVASSRPVAARRRQPDGERPSTHATSEKP